MGPSERTKEGLELVDARPGGGVGEGVARHVEPGERGRGMLGERDGLEGAVGQVELCDWGELCGRGRSCEVLAREVELSGLGLGLGLALGLCVGSRVGTTARVRVSGRRRTR